MNHAELKRKFPNASEDFLRANVATGGAGQDSVMERPARHDALEKNQDQTPAANRLHIVFVSFRQRLCDPDNLSVKWLLDCLRYCGAIAGDEPEKITLEVRQEKVKLLSDERTEIEIYE